ncbi:hypothetical protein STEG23_035068 [Scotinomys teguina]
MMIVMGPCASGMTSFYQQKLASWVVFCCGLLPNCAPKYMKLKIDLPNSVKNCVGILSYTASVVRFCLGKHLFPKSVRVDLTETGHLMLLNDHRFLNQMVQLLREVMGQAFGLKDSHDFITSHKMDLDHTICQLQPCGDATSVGQC